MTNDQRGEYAELLLQHMRSGKPFNTNQQFMLVELGTHPDEPEYEIEAALSKALKRSPPSYALTPEPSGEY